MNKKEKILAIVIFGALFIWIVFCLGIRIGNAVKASATVKENPCNKCLEICNSLK